MLEIVIFNLNLMLYDPSESQLLPTKEGAVAVSETKWLLG